MDNSDFYLRLGQKIKKKRKESGLTQSQVCKESMTRNMLSQIENGLAHPSVDTLLYLSKALSVPMGYLVCPDAAEEAQYEKLSAQRRIHRLFDSGRYGDCACACEALSRGDREIDAVYARCELLLAEELMNSVSLSQADSHLTNAAHLSSGNPLCTSVLASARLYHHMIDAIKNGRHLTSGELAGFESVSDSGLFIYLLSLAFYREGQRIAADSLAEICRNMTRRQFLTARSLMDDGSFENASSLLRQVLSSSPDFYTEYLATEDMEYCSRQCENYKEAYEYATKRVALKDKYSKGV